MTSTSRLPRRAALATAFAALTGVSAGASAIDLEYSLKLKAGVQTEGDRSLGTATTGDDQTTQGFIDAAPAVRLQFTPDLAAYVRAQGFLPTGELTTEEDERTIESKSFVALREAWVEYGGLTSYPGEVLRLGLQRLRQADGQWLDRDIESLRWIFDTTLVQAQIGAAEQFATYRSDDIELSRSQKNRPYLFGDLGGQWTPGHFVGLRAVYAQDQGSLPADGSVPDEDDKLEQRHYGWVGLRAENGYYDFQRAQPLSYWAELSWLTGDRKAAELAPDPGPLPLPGTPAVGTVVGQSKDDVNDHAVDLGLRARFSETVPVILGAAYAASSGDYEQTGLQSNRSRFTGTRSLIHRYNEAYRAELGNLQAMTGFLAYSSERYDASLIYSRFRRDDENRPVIAEGLTATPTVASHDLGSGVDLVLSYYFDGPGGGKAGLSSYDEDLRSNLRLRASMFNPGDAYGPDADEFYRVMLETTLWF